MIQLYKFGVVALFAAALIVPTYGMKAEARVRHGYHGPSDFSEFVTPIKKDERRCMDYCFNPRMPY